MSFRSRISLSKWLKSPLFAVALIPSTDLCPKWNEAKVVGHLDAEFIDESSGMAVSRKHPLLYHINDSGDGKRFYVTDREGKKAKAIHVEGLQARDTEDLGIGPCPKAKGDCLAIADIGDNRLKRETVEIVFVEEEKLFPRIGELNSDLKQSALRMVASRVPIHFRLKLRYPDRAHNAEAFALLPNGDVVIVTKETDKGGIPQPAQVFRLRGSEYQSKHQSEHQLENRDAQAANLEKIGELDIPTILGQKGIGALVTGMSVSRNGSRFLILTYRGAVEFKVSLAAERIPVLEKKDYSVIPIKQLLQQESIAYDQNDRDFFYSTEVMKKIFVNSSKAQLVKVSCDEGN